MFRVWCLLIGYCFGMAQWAYIIGKAKGNIDIRDHGSGNAGMTNVTRVMGAKAGAAVFVLDIVKAMAAFCVCAFIFGGTVSFLPLAGANGALPGMYGGLGAIIGHSFPVWLKFRGGKGVSCMAGFIICIGLWPSVVAAVLAIGLIFLTRYVSLGSVVMAVTLPVSLALFGFGAESAAVAGFAAGLTVVKHWGNIVRLCKGEERKFLSK